MNLKEIFWPTVLERSPSLWAGMAMGMAQFIVFVRQQFFQMVNIENQTAKLKPTAGRTLSPPTIQNRRLQGIFQSSTSMKNQEESLDEITSILSNEREIFKECVAYYEENRDQDRTYQYSKSLHVVRGSDNRGSDEFRCLCLSGIWWSTNVRYGKKKQYGHLHASNHGSFHLGTHGKYLGLCRPLVSVLTNNPCYQRVNTTDHIETNESDCVKRRLH